MDCCHFNLSQLLIRLLTLLVHFLILTNSLQIVLPGQVFFFFSFGVNGKLRIMGGKQDQIGNRERTGLNKYIFNLFIRSWKKDKSLKVGKDKEKLKT